MERETIGRDKDEDDKRYQNQHQRLTFDTDKPNTTEAHPEDGRSDDEVEDISIANKHGSRNTGVT